MSVARRGTTTAVHDAERSKSGITRAGELAISRLLRGGVTVSFVLILAGTALSMVHHPSWLHSAEAYAGLTSPGIAQPHGIREILSQVVNLKGQAFVMLGILTLVATPVIRVALSIVLFLGEGDLVFVWITATVLGLLSLSFLLGKAGG